MHELRTDIEIAASAQEIWDVLVDFPVYSRWNPFIRHVQGIAEEGSSLEVSIHPPGARRTKIRATVLVADPPREMRWRAQLIFPEVFEIDHQFLFTPLPGGEVRFEQNFASSGLMALLLRESVDRSIFRGFREMNSALKGRVERCAAARSSEAAAEASTDAPAEAPTEAPAETPTVLVYDALNEPRARYARR